MKIIIIFMSFILFGCVKTPSKDNEAFYKAWQLSFKECLELAAKNHRESDDDVSDLIDSCHQSSLMMNRYLDKDSM
jgi:hypothetical protein